MEKEKTAIIYSRVSTVRQADDGLPIESQIEHGYKKAESLPAQVVREFTDAGISGRTDERPAFREAIAYCKTYSIDYFICWSTSRFARNKLDAALYKRELEKNGTRVVYVSVDLDNRTDAGWMMESILEIFDEHYSRQISSDTLRSMIKNAKDGFFNGGTVPFGYTAHIVGKRVKLFINDQEAAIVREIYRHYLEGIGIKAICTNLNERGLYYRSGPWTKNQLTHLLKSEVYCGLIVFNKTNRTTRKLRPREEWIITKSHEPIIEEVTFMAVQSLFDSRKPAIGVGSPKSNFVFTGMLKCGSCGATLQIETATGRDRVYHYYNCRNWLVGKSCVPRRFPAEELDVFLITTILDKVLTAHMMAETVADLHELSSKWINDRAQKRADLSNTMRGVETRLRNLYEVLELHGKDAPNLGDLTIRIRELRLQRDAAETALIALEAEKPPTGNISRVEIEEMAELMRDVVLNTTDERKLRGFFSSFVEKIVIEAKEVKIEYNGERIMNRAQEGTVHSHAIWLPDLGSNQGHTD